MAGLVAPLLAAAGTDKPLSPHEYSVPPHPPRFLGVPSASGSFKPTDQSSVSYHLDRLILESDPEEESTWIHVIRVRSVADLRSAFGRSSIVSGR